MPTAPSAAPRRALGHRLAVATATLAPVSLTHLRAASFAALLAALSAAPLQTGAAEKPFEMEPFQLVLLLRPVDRKVIPEAEAEAIQKQHIAHLEKMGRTGKMVIAGPFDAQRDPSLRGACIYRVATPDEARALAEDDPAVKAGRLRVEVVTWYVGKGYMTFPKAPAPESLTSPGPAPGPSASPADAPAPAPSR